MKQSTTRLTVFLTAGIFLTALTGCDLFNPPKKAASKPVEATASDTSAAPATKTSMDDQGPLSGDVVARVGNWKMTNDEFNQRLKLLKQGLPDFNDKDPKTRKAVLEELINQQILVKDAEDSDIASQQDIKDAIDDFRRTLLVQELAQRLTKGVEASDEDVSKYYSDNKTLFTRWKVRQIQVEDEATAKNILVQILQGGDFAAIAKAQSKDKFAAEGGLIPDAALAQLPGEVQKNITALESNGTSAVFKGPQGFYIVHVDDKSAVPLSEVKEKLKANLSLRKQQEAIIQHIAQLKEKTKIDINNELLGGAQAK